MAAENGGFAGVSGEENLRDFIIILNRLTMNQTTQDLDRLRQMNTDPGFRIITARPAGMNLKDYHSYLQHQKTHIKNRINKPFWWALGVKAPAGEFDLTGKAYFKYLIQPMGTFVRPKTVEA